VKKLFLTILFCLIATSGWCATNTWQNGGVNNNWSTAGNWTDGVPTADDDVVFPASTGWAVTIDAAAVCRSLNATSYDTTMTHAAAVTLTIGDGTAGAGDVALAFGSGMTYTLGNSTTSAIAFISTSATVQTINFNSHKTGNVSFNAASNGSWQLTGTWGDSSATATQVLTLTKGALDIDDETVHVGRFTSDNSNVRSLDMGSGTINLYGASTNVMYMNNLNNYTVTAGTGTIIFNGGGSTCFHSATKTYYEIQFIGGGTSTLSGGVSLTNLTVTGTAIKTNGLSLVSSQTVTGTLTLAGNSEVNRLLVYSSTLGSARTITNTGATETWSNVDFRDITMSEAVDASAITGGSGDCGGNTDITFTTADDWFWKGSGTRNLSDYTYWYTETNGGGSQMASTRTVLPQDTLWFDADSIDGATTVDQDLPRIPGIDFTGVDAMNFHINNIGQEIYGGYVMSSNVTETDNSSIGMSFLGRGTHSFTPTTKAYTFSPTFHMHTGTLNIGANFNTTNWFRVTSGTLNTNGHTISCNAMSSSSTGYTITFDFTNSIFNISQSGQFGGTAWGNTGSSTRNYTGTGSTINFTNTSGAYTAINFDGAGKTYNNFTVSGGATTPIVITGSNTFNTITINAPRTVKLTSGTTQTVNSFVVVNDGTEITTLSSVTADSIATITDANGGTNECDYLDVVDVTGTPADTWYYGANGSADNATGWAASATPATPVTSGRRIIIY